MANLTPDDNNMYTIAYNAPKVSATLSCKRIKMPHPECTCMPCFTEDVVGVLLLLSFSPMSAQRWRSKRYPRLIVLL